MSDKTGTPSTSPTTGDQTTLVTSDIGGIDHAEITFSPGITTLSGENATNRSSFLRSINEALGGTMGSIRRGAPEKRGRAELVINDDTYSRTLTQRGSRVSRSGSPYTTATKLVDLYVSLLEHNEIRQLIETGDLNEIGSELAELLMAPVDVDAIQQEIKQHQQRKHEIEGRLETIRAAKEELSELEERQQARQREIDELESAIATKREQIGDLDINRGRAEQAEKRLDSLEAAQEEFREIETQIDHKEWAIEEIEQHLAERRDEMEAIEERIEDISPPGRDALQILNERQQRVQRVTSLLDNLAEISRTLVQSDPAGDLEDELNVDLKKALGVALDQDSQRVACPICDTHIEREMIQQRADTLADSAIEYRDKAEKIEERQAELRSKRRKHEELQDKRDGLQSEIWQLKERLEDESQHIEELEDSRKSKRTKINELQEQVEETREQRSQELEELYDEIAELQGDRAGAEAERKRIESQITDHRSTISDEDELREELADVEDTIEDRRTHITSREERIQSAATTHMEAMVDRLNYDRIEGIRLDRVPVNDPATFSEFRLVVARRRKDGAVIDEENLDTLSESERSLIGLVVALSGYVAHGVPDEVPFLLLDSIEQFDHKRIAQILSYVRDAVDVTYIIAALLPEDAAKVGVEDEEIAAEVLG